MAKVALYKTEFEFPDRYVEGQPLTATEAKALNGYMAERCSHIVRRKLLETDGAVLTDAEDNKSINPDFVEHFSQIAAELAANYEFDAPRATSAPVDPLEAECIAVAKSELRKAIKQQGKKLGKQDGSNDGEEGIVPYSRFMERVEANKDVPSIVKMAKKNLAERNKPVAEGLSVEF